MNKFIPPLDPIPEGFIPKESYEFKICTSEKYGEDLEFLAVRVGEKGDQTGWFNLYVCEMNLSGDYEYATTQADNETILEMAFRYMIDEGYKKECLTLDKGKTDE